MATQRLPRNLAKLLRSHGLKVVVVPGWRKRGRPATTGDFNPVGVLCHHTATRKTSAIGSVISLLVNGRPDLPGPLCQIGLGRDGTVYLIAAGRGNHAGVSKASGTVAGGDGNELYIGIEAFNDGVGEVWPKVQMDSYELLCAVLSLFVTQNTANTVRGHKETSVTGKVDPTFDMNAFRTRVGVLMGELRRPRTAGTSRGEHVDAAIASLKKARGSEGRMKNVKAALSALKLIKPFKQD